MNAIDIMKLLCGAGIIFILIAVFYTAVSFLIDYAKATNSNRADNKSSDNSDEELSEAERIEKERRKWYFLPH